MSDIELSLRGLSTDGSPHSQPGGSLRQAKNVISRRQDTLEQRPGFKVNSNDGLPAPYVTRDQTVAMVSFDGSVHFVNHDDAGLFYMGDLDSSNVEFTTESGALPAWPNATQASFAESRGNLYTNCSDGVRKAPGGNADLHTAGVPIHFSMLLQSVNTVGAEAIASAKYVAYRATIEREDPSGLVATSQPTGRYVVGVGSPSDPTFRVYLGSGVNVGGGTMTLRLWRSKNASTKACSDQMFQCARIELTGSHISAGYVDIEDSTADADLGAALYTNPEREGLVRANHRPPLCTTMCEYQGSVLYGNITGPARVTFSAPMTTGNQNGTADSVGFREFTGTRTNATNTITGLSGITGLEVGQMLWDDTNWGSGPVLVTAVGGTTATMSTTYTGSTDGAPVAITFYDTIRLKSATEDQYYPICTDGGGASAKNSGPAEFAAAVCGSGRSGTSESDEFLVYTTNDQQAASLSGIPSFATDEYPSIVVEEIHRGGAFEVFATHGDLYDPPIPTPDQGSGLAAEADNWTDAVFVSKNKEPEHVPLASFYRTGTLGSDLIRMVPTKDTTYLFKEDGLYAFSGYGERSGFRVDPVDLSLVLVSPRCAVELDGAVYAWCSRGVVRVGGGVTDISSAFIESDLRAAQRAIGTNNTATTGVFMVANPTTHEIYLGVTETSGADTCDKIYVFNTKTQVWSTWEGGPLGDVACGVVHGSALYLGNSAAGGAGGGFTIFEERQADSWRDSADASYTLSGATITSTNITWSSSSPGTYSPAVGDLIDDDGDGLAVVTIVNSSTDVDVTELLPMDTSSTGTAYSSYECCVGWTAKSARHPLFMKQFSEFAVGFEGLRGVKYWSAKFDSSTGSAESTISQTEAVNNLTGSESSQTRRAFVDQEHARCAVLKPSICIQQAGQRWRLVASALKYTPISERIHA